MTERRTTITLGWRPPGVPTRRVDDFVEVPATSAPIQQQRAPIPERRSIGRRLENWGAWANATPSRGGSSDNMTAVICENMRRNAVGELHPPAPVNDRIDVIDAERINSAFTRLPELHRGVLHWTYIAGAKSWAVAGACGFPSREYDAKLREAQGAIEGVVAEIGRS